MTEHNNSSSAENWKNTTDRGSPWLIDLIIWIILNLGRTTGRLFLFPIVLYFVLSSSTRKYSRRYLQRNFLRAGKKPPGILDIYQHYYSFANMLLDRVFFLTGKTDKFDIRLHNEQLLTDFTKQGEGVILLGSHLGNFDALRALAGQADNIKIRALMYNNEQQNVNRAFEKLNPHLKKDIIYIGTPEAMLQVHEDINNAYVIGMLADRVEQDNRSSICDFLGAKAKFPSGPLIVAHLLKAPVIVCFALYHSANRYDIYFHKLADPLNLPRKQREEKLQHYMQDYAAILEQHALHYPYNWYNFYDFWHDYDCS